MDSRLRSGRRGAASTVKSELADWFEGHGHAKMKLFAYVEVFYNQLVNAEEAFPERRIVMAIGLTDKVIRGMLVVAVGATVVLLVVMAVMPAPTESELKLRYMQFYYEAFKTLLVSFVAGVLIVVVPQYLNEAKYTFERLRESRRAYSEAHTGITYLEYKLAVLDYGAAMALIEDIHVKKHMAETYDELARHLGRKGEPVTAWSDRIAVKLDKLKNEVGADFDRWTNSTPQERLARLLPASKGRDPA